MAGRTGVAGKQHVAAPKGCAGTRDGETMLPPAFSRDYIQRRIVQES